MKLRMHLTFVFLLCFSFAFSQDFVPGYIVKNSEKIGGLIKYNRAIAKKGVLFFKKDASSESQELTTQDVEYFHLNPHNASFKVVTGEENKKIFAEVLIEGDLTYSSHGKLYILTKKNGEEFSLNIPLTKEYLSRNRLEYKGKRLAEIKVAGSLSNFLKGDLASYFDGCPDAKPNRISEYGIRRLVKAYNVCASGIRSDLRKPQSSFNIIAGVGATTLKFANSTEPMLNSAKFDTHLTKRFGISIDVLPKKFLDRSVFSFQIIYADYKFSGKSSTLQGGTTRDDVYEFSYNTLRFPISFKKYFNYGRDGLFLNPGVYPYFSLNKKSYHQLRYSLGGVDLSNTEYVDFIHYKGMNGAAFLGLGYTKSLTSKMKLSSVLRGEIDFAPFHQSKVYTASLDINLSF